MIGNVLIRMLEIPAISALYRCRRATAALEFGLLAPVLLMIVIGISLFGIVLNNYLIITSAAAQGAMTLALTRGTTTPYSTTTTAINSAAMTLNTSNLVVTMTVNGSACTSDATCQALTGSPGKSVVVSITYPCNLTILGISYGGATCRIGTQSAQVLQ